MDPFVLRNTLLPPEGIDHLSSLPIENHIYPALTEILAKFQDIKKFASEIHTEIHLVKPILKLLGYTYESKPKFFEDNVKDPDVALFASEDIRTSSSKLWGTPPYYANTLGILVLKRYGRNLHEGISGFYLEFENRIPLYQIMYLLKKARAPWGILTNGRYWLLIKKPGRFEQRLIEVDLEAPLLAADEKAPRLFYNVFSMKGLNNTVPGLLEQERESLIEFLKAKKRAIKKSIGTNRKKIDVYPKVRNAYQEFFPGDSLPATDAYLQIRGVGVETFQASKLPLINDHDGSDICSYLFTANPAPTDFDIEEVLTNKNQGLTKEDLLSLRILDMTPGFGNIANRLLEGLAYLSFVLPYKEKNSFIAEWEDEGPLKKYILDRMLFGVERSHLCFDAFQNMLAKRFGYQARHYRLGNPLIGISLKDISNMFDASKQMSLFGKSPKELLNEFKEMYRLYFSLSQKIKEDVKIRDEIEVKIRVYGDRIRDIMDVITATFFTKTVDNRKVEEMVFNLDAEEPFWATIRDKDWFIETKQIAARNGFFHMELEFPVLLHNAFDLVLVQPSLNYAWEDKMPVPEATKAFIRKGMAYLKGDGRFVVLLDGNGEDIKGELQKSKKYAIEASKGFLVITKR